jgi:protein arginine N-methyltransferase 1
MNISKKEIIRIKSQVKTNFAALGIEVSTVDRTLVKNPSIFKLFTIFHAWITIEDGMKQLAEVCKNKEGFMRASADFHDLLKNDFFEFQNEASQNFGFHSGKFDSFPVHIRMLNDKARTLAFQKAIRATVGPTDIVLDIGTGNGILAATAAMAGAKHVYAVERTEFIEVARAVFKANGLADKITLIKGDSSNISLPEKATVLVSEIIGNDPFDEGILRTFNDANQRLLTDDAKVIPQSISVFAVAVEAPAHKHNQLQITASNLHNWKEWYGIDFSAFLDFNDDREVHKLSQKSAAVKNWNLLSAPLELAHIALKNKNNKVEAIEKPLALNGNGMLNGVLLYFETHLSENNVLSLHPNQVADSNHWSCPLFLVEGKQVHAGEVVKLNYALKGLKSSIEIHAL